MALTSKNKKQFYQILRESSKTALENYAVYKCKQQVRPFQPANPPLQKPPNKFQFHDDLFLLSRIKLIAYNKLSKQLSFHKSSIKKPIIKPFTEKTIK